MRSHRLLVSLAFAATALASRTAFAGDPAGAVAELKEGYGLKQAGNCREALPHFGRSFELDAKPKALLNLADCEEQLGDLVAAQSHATQGRHLAQAQNDTELAGVADEQLAAIDRRLPRLTVRLAPTAPTGATVTRDGVPLESTSLGTQTTVNPGRHTIVAYAPGYAERRFDVTVAEGAREQIDVEPGASVTVAQPDTPRRPYPQTAILLTYGAFGIAAVGLTVGITAGLTAGSKYDALKGECNGNDCPPSAQGDLAGFQSLRTWSTVGYVVGAAGLLGGASLWLFASPTRSTSPTARLWVGASSAGLGGVF